MADSIATFVHKTARMGDGLRRLEHQTVLIAAVSLKKSVEAQLLIAGVDNGKLRGVGKKGAKVGVRYDLAGKTALVRATGPFQLIENATKAHRIPRTRGTRARKRYVVIPGVGVRAWANHPGTKGKHPWAKGVAAAIPIAEKAGGIALAQTVIKAYR